VGCLTLGELGDDEPEQKQSTHNSRAPAPAAPLLFEGDHEVNGAKFAGERRRLVNDADNWHASLAAAYE